MKKDACLKTQRHKGSFVVVDVVVDVVVVVSCCSGDMVGQFGLDWVACDSERIGCCGKSPSVYN